MRLTLDGFQIEASTEVRQWALTLATILATAIAPLRTSAQFTPFELELARFDAEVAFNVLEDAGGAVSVAVFSGTEVIWTKGYGWADIDGRVAADARTIGRTGSISKSFTAVLMMQLVERGIIELDDRVNDYFPEIEGLVKRPVGAEPITFRMLGSHTAGLVREPELEGAAVGSIYSWEEKVLSSIPTTAYQTKPLTEYSYSNIGFGILGLALSRASGVPFMELIETLIIRPLGMESTTFILDSPELLTRMSVGYSRDRMTGELSAEQATREHFGRGYKVPNGGIYSTVHDLAKLGAALMGEGDVQILSEESRSEMFSPQAPATTYGLGLFLYDSEEGPLLVGHSGSVAGYNAYLAFDPKTKLGVSMFRTTSYNPPVADLLRQLTRTISSG